MNFNVYGADLLTRKEWKDAVGIAGRRINLKKKMMIRPVAADLRGIA